MRACTPTLSLVCLLVASLVSAGTPEKPADAAPGTPDPVSVATDPGSPDAAPATAPGLTHYQGRFTDTSGNPLAGPIKLQFRIYDVETGGAALWTETHNSVPLTGGVASVLLGSLVTFPAVLFDGGSRFLALTVNDQDLSPRLRIVSAPFAIEAARLEGKRASDFEPNGAVIALSVDDGSPPNSGSNRVHWNNLTGVPPGFADGDDFGVNDHGNLTGLLDDDHPQYAKGEDLKNSSGTGPNTGKNLVNWENLVGVPTGFADGADNTGPGITDHGQLTGLLDDDHPQYATDVDLAAHAAAPDPHPQYATDVDLAAHVAAPDPHPQYATDADLQAVLDDSTLGHPPTTDAGDLVTGTLDPARLPVNGITTEHIQDGTVGAQDMEPGLLDSLLLGDAAVDSVNLAPGAVHTVHIADGAVTAAKIPLDEIDSGRIKNRTIIGDDVALDGIDRLNIADEPGIQFAGVAARQDLGDSVQVLVSRTIQVPVDGWVMASVVGEGCIDPPPQTGENGIRLSVSLNPGTFDTDAQTRFFLTTVVGSTNCASLATQKVFLMPAGTWTFYALGRGIGDADKGLAHVNLNLQFFSTRY